MHIKTYREAKQYLESLIPDPEERRKGNLRLERIRHLLELLGNPQNRFKSIHIGGTSGKGSTAFLISSLLVSAGYKVGLHLSPHLQVITERMQVNNRFINVKDFVKLVNDIQPLVDRVEREGRFGRPSYFEVLVALSFQYFAIKKVDIAVIEVGLGGTFDATNVIHPLVAVITNVSLDHTDILGDTIEKIAQDKAGIIKEGIEVVTGASQMNVIEIIEKRCKEKGAQLTKMKISGLFQEQNAALAIAAVKKLEKQRFFVSHEVIKKILHEATFAGRLEIVRKDPLTIVDGAHNPAKMQALVGSLKVLFPKKKFISIIAFKKGKDIKAMLQELLPITSKFVLTRFHSATDTGPDVSMPLDQITRVLSSIAPNTPYHVQEKITKLPTRPTLITGSLYLVGELRNRWYPWRKVLENRTWYV